MAGGPNAATLALQDAVQGGNLASTGRSSGECRLKDQRGLRMLGWLKQYALKSFTETQKREMTEWIDNLAQANSGEVAVMLCIATHIRNQIELERDVDLLDPIVTSSAKPTFVMFLHGMIQAFQKLGQPSDAAGVMVWLFTLRAGENIALRGIGRRLWRELSRGIPKVEEAELNYYSLTGKMYDTTGYQRIPIGLEPIPT